MPNSIKCKVKHLCHNGTITERERDRILKALEQEPCEDAISRKELLNAIYTWDKFGCDADNKLVQYRDHYIPYIHYDDVVKCIKGMPSVNPQKSGWIPVSERLPEKYTYTLWCASSGYVMSDYFNGEFWEDAKKYCYEIIAWMPLPKPFEPQESEVK